MTRKVLDVGQCNPDHKRISNTLCADFDVDIQRAETHGEAIQMARHSSFDLIMVNRLLDASGTAGLEVLRALKSDPVTAGIPVMLVSNFDDVQSEAVAAGAVPGFGKNSLGDSKTLARLREFLAD